MTTAQRVMYIAEARKAYAACADWAGCQLDFETFRHYEVGHALQRTKSFNLFTQMELTRVLIHFWALQDGERLTPGEIWIRARARQDTNRLEPLRALYNAIAPPTRIHVLEDRFKIKFFEEIGDFGDREFHWAYNTLSRLAREYPAPAAQPEADPCLAN